MKPLRPCPICGRKPDVYITAGECYDIECQAGVASSYHIVRAGSDKSYEAARKAWNGQPDDRPYGGRAGIRERLEED